MKGQIYKKITTTVVAAAIIAAALTTDTADALFVCAQEVSSGDSEFQETPENVNTEEEIPQASAENSQEPETVTVPEAPAENPQEPEAVIVPEIPAEPEPLAANDAVEPALLADPASGPDAIVPGQPSATYVYDGAVHDVSLSLDTTFTGDDGANYKLEGTVNVSAKNVSQSSFVITDFSNVTMTNLDTMQTVTPGPLTVLAQVIAPRPVTARSMNLIKVYDGNPLENRDTPLAEETGWVDGEGANYTFTGSRTAIGTDINAFTATSGKNGTDLSNYTISYVYGAITVVERPEDQKYILTVEGNNLTTKYSGKEQTVTGYVLEGRSDSEFQVNGTGDPSQVLMVTIGNAVFSVTGIAASATGKNAGTYAVNITGSPVVRDAQGSDVTSQFKFEFKPGTLEITKRSVTLTSGSLTKKYTKDTITKHTVTVSGDGFAEGEGATYTYSGKQKGVGESYNYFSYKLNDGTLADNYDIEKVPGKLRIKKPEDTAINEEPKSDNSGSANNEAVQESQPDNNAANVNQADQAKTTPSGEQVNENVLGAKRGGVTVDIKKKKKSKKSKKKSKKSKQVLGARRGSTEDQSHMDRHLLVFAAAVIFMAALKIKRKKSVRK